MQSPFRNRWVRVFLWIVLAVLLLWALLWAAVPPIVKSQLPRVLGEQLGRKVSIGAVDFKPWTLELTARDLTVATADGTGTQAKVSRIYLNAEIESLLRLAPILDAVHVDDPYLLVTRQADGSLDIDDIRKQFSSKPAPEKSSNDPFRFALHDVLINNGAVVFVDRVTDSKHRLQDLQLRLMVLSSLAGARETKIEPRLSFELDGVAFKASGSGTPYADSRSGSGTLNFSGLDVAPYLPYLPAGLPVQLTSARLDAQLQLAYEQAPQPALKISGAVTAHEVALANPQGEPLVALEQARITLADLSPLQQQVAVQRIELDAPRVALRRDQDGQLALLTNPGASAADAAKPAAPADQATAEPGKPWQVSVDQVALNDGQLVWFDASTQPQAHAHLRNLQLQASQITYPFKQPAQFSGSAAVGARIPEGDAPLTAPIAAAAPLDVAVADTTLEFKGQATDRAATVQWGVEGMPFSLGELYLAQFLEPNLRGTLSAHGAVEWQAAPGPGASDSAAAAKTVVRIDQLVLADVALDPSEAGQADQPLASVGKLALSDATVNLRQRTVEVDKLQIDNAIVHAGRTADGRWMAQDWLKTKPPAEQVPTKAMTQAVANGPAVPAQGSNGASAPDWSLKLDTFALNSGAVTYTDHALAEQPVKAALAGLDVQASNLNYPLEAPAEFSGSAKLAALPGADPSPVEFKGQVSSQGGQVALQVNGLPVAAAEPLLAQVLAARVTGQATLDGILQWSASAAEAPDGKTQVLLRANRFVLDDLALHKGEQTPVHVGKIELKEAGVDLGAKHIELGRLEISDPQVDVARAADGRWMFEDWLKKKPAEASAAAQAPAPDAVSSPAESDPWSFALNEFRLAGGNISYTDRALAEQPVSAELSKLQLQASRLVLPFAQPAEFSGSALLATSKGGQPSPLEFKGQASDTQADVTVRLADVPFVAARPFYAKYLKPTLSGSATLDGAVQWRAAASTDEKKDGGGSARLTLRANELTLNNVALSEADRRLAGIERVTIANAAIDLSRQQVEIGKVELRSPTAKVSRSADGRWMYEDWLRTPAAGNPGESKGDAATEARGQSSPPAWNVDLARLSVVGGQVDYVDRALGEQPIDAELSKIELQATKLGYPFDQPAKFDGSALLAAKAAGGPSKIAFSGSASAAQATVEVKAEQLPLALAEPFYASLLEPTLRGSASIDGTLQWQGAKGPDGAARTLVRAKRFALNDVALTRQDNELARVRQLIATDATLDLAARQANIGKLQVSEPVASVERDEQGQWMFEQWLKPAAGAGPSGVSAERAKNDAAAAVPDANTWGVKIADAALAGGRIAFRDRAQPQPVAFDLSRIQLETQDFKLAGTEPAPLHVSARIESATGQNASGDAGGQFDYRGQVTLRPQLQAQGAIDATQIPVHLFEPYFGSQLNVEIAKADASFKGDAGYAQTDAGPRMSLSGDLTVQDLRAIAVAAAAAPASTGNAGPADAADDTQVGDELVNWKTLNLTGLKVAVAPGQPTLVALEQTALSDFFARLILYPDGKLNLQGLVKSDGAVTPEAAADTSGAAAASPSQPAAVIDIGTTSFVNGRLYFTDLLIKPNYSARLSDLTGKLGAFSSRVPASGQPELAQLELRGSTEQGASIAVDGRLNPLAKPLALDIEGKVRGLELPPFSAYSVKYAGHPIERGRLSMDVHYRIKPDGQLTAENNLVLTQLRFGEKVGDAPHSLPVKLAVALLAGPDGVIDLDLPISGSIDDPKFSIADVLGNAVGNLLGKAVTAPFSLLARAIGGVVGAGDADVSADTLNSVTFAPGNAELSARARSKLDRVAQALQQRDSLQLTIAGTAGNPAEREAWKRAQLQRELDREQLNGSPAQQAEPAAGGADSAEPNATKNDASATVDASTASSDDMGAAPAAAPLPSSPLRRLYQQSDIPKPRNPDGTDQPLSDKEMETLMLSRIEANDEALRELAVQRGVVVRDYLESAGLAKSRLFLGAAKLSGADQLAESASGAEAAAGGKSDRYLPHAELNLETR